MQGQYEIITAPGTEIRFRLRSATGQVLVTSRPYASLDETLHAVAHFKTVSVEAQRYRERLNEDNRWLFEVLASDGHALAHSEPFASDKFMRARIALTQLSGPGASLRPVIDR